MPYRRVDMLLSKPFFDLGILQKGCEYYVTISFAESIWVIDGPFEVHNEAQAMVARLSRSSRKAGLTPGIDPIGEQVAHVLMRALRLTEARKGESMPAAG